MNYSVQVAGGGVFGWRFLKETGASQKDIIRNEVSFTTAQQRFRESAKKVDTVDGLLGNYNALKIALGAFGLQGDIRNKSFIKKVLESDLADSKSFANRLGDKRYVEMATFFAGKLNSKGLAEETIAQLGSRYVDQIFEERVGEQDTSLRVALSAGRELEKLAAGTESSSAKWYKVVGSPAMRKVFEGVFGLGSSFGKLPVDRQHDELQARFEKEFGTNSLEVLASDKDREALLKRYLVRSAAQAAQPLSPFSIAATLLSKSPRLF